MTPRWLAWLATRPRREPQNLRHWFYGHLPIIADPNWTSAADRRAIPQLTASAILRRIDYTC